MAEGTRAINGLYGSHPPILSSFTNGEIFRQGSSHRHRRVQSAPLSSSSLSTTFSQRPKEHYGKPEYQPQPIVDLDGEVQPHDDHENIKIEELAEGEIDNASEADILRPDVYEDADSVQGNEGDEQGYESQDDNQRHGGIIEGFRTLHCGSEEDKLAVEGGRKRRKKRRSDGIFKRSHSQSIGNGTDEEPPDAHGLEHDARRLRRRVRGPGGGHSLERPPGTQVDCEEFDDVISLETTPKESEMEDCSIESASLNTTEDAMEID